MMFGRFAGHLTAESPDPPDPPRPTPAPRLPLVPAPTPDRRPGCPRAALRASAAACWRPRRRRPSRPSPRRLRPRSCRAIPASRAATCTAPASSARPAPPCWPASSRTATRLDDPAAADGDGGARRAARRGPGLRRPRRGPWPRTTPRPATGTAAPCCGPSGSRRPGPQWEAGLQLDLRPHGHPGGAGPAGPAGGETAKAYNLLTQMQRQGVDEAWLHRPAGGDRRRQGAVGAGAGPPRRTPWPARPRVGRD